MADFINWVVILALCYSAVLTVEPWISCFSNLLGQLVYNVDSAKSVWVGNVGGGVKCVCVCAMCVSSMYF